MRSIAKLIHKGVRIMENNENKPGQLNFVENAIYSKEDLERMLCGKISLKTFLQNVSPARIFNKAYYGRDLIAALNRRGDVCRGEHRKEYNREIRAIASSLLGGAVLQFEKWQFDGLAKEAIEFARIVYKESEK